MDYQEMTIATYNASAKQLAEYFAGIGTRIPDIEKAIELAHETATARVVEIGCGDGRDALDIIDRTGSYRGFDPSAGLLALAKERLPTVDFQLATATSYEYPSNTDIVYSFASLLHVDKESLKSVFQKVHASLRRDGIFYISLKEGIEYEEKIKEDQFGKRMFYVYSEKTVIDLAHPWFTLVYAHHYLMGHTKWLTIALQNKVL